MRAPPLILAGAALALAACGEGRDRRGDTRICTPFPEAKADGQAANTAALAPATPAAAVDDCLHRWGYTLAASSDRADEVAQAAVAACTSAIAQWNQQGLTTGAVPTAPAAEAQSLVTGEPSNAMAEHYAYARNRALFYVVQGRAGKCAAPARPANSVTAPAR